MPARLQARELYSLSALVAAVVAIGAIGAQSSIALSRTAATAATARDTTRPRIQVDAPVPGPLLNGVAIIRFRTENVRIASLFNPVGSSTDSTPAAHLHVTVDSTSWHWVHSTSDPVVVAPLAPGKHTVTMELADSDHRPLDSQSVRFTVVPPTPRPHSGHR